MKLRHAQRGSEAEYVSLPALVDRMAPYFEAAHGGHMIDQAWQPRLAEGMVRSYLVADRVTGFGHQAVNALCPAKADEAAPTPGPRLYHGPDLPEFQSLEQKLESQWIEQLCNRVDLDRARLPLLWDCDFMLGGAGPAAPGEPDRFVLCEVNVSSLSPFPPSSIAPLVHAVQSLLSALPLKPPTPKNPSFSSPPDPGAPAPRPPAHSADRCGS